MRNALQTQLGRLRDLWLIIGVTLLLFLSTELLTSVLFHLKDSSIARAVIDQRSSADTYSHAGWPSLYYKELADSSTAQWVPYVYWKRTPFRGQYINVDSQGNRVTWYAEMAAPMSNDVNILILGGSTVWGLGSRDEFTIPSLLAKKLAERGVRARVTNLGQIGYVSTQDVTALLLEIQKGNVPDIVIFYNGFNDIFSAYQQGKAGFPQNEFHRVQEFNSLKMPKAATPRWEIVAKELSTVRAAKALLHRAGAMKSAQASVPNQGEMVDGPPAGQVENLARDVVSVYRANVENAKALAAHFGFKVLFYWQPSLFQKRHLTDYEQMEKRVHRKFQRFFEQTYRTMRESNLTATNVGVFDDLSRIFFEAPEPLFVDWCHVGETGNALIADRMMMDVWPIAQRAASSVSSVKGPSTS